MPRGASEIADLRLSRLQGLITKFQSAPNLKLRNMFPSSNAASDTIEWESQTGFRGLAPFKSPGAKTPQVAPRGVAKHSAKAAFWGEKMPLDEEFLNNLRKAGTREQYQEARATLAQNLSTLRYDVDRREEWMYAKMLSVGSFTYKEKDGIKTSVNYQIPSAHSVTLTSDYKWGTGSSADILGDIRDAKLLLQTAVGANSFLAICTTTVLRYMIENTSITNLLKMEAFPMGNPLGKSASNVIAARPEVLGRLLDLTLMIYDEQYEVEATLTGAVTADSTTVISVDDAADFEVGATLTFHDVSEGTSEDETISAVDEQAGTVTVSSAPSTSYKAGEDKVTMTTTFIPKDKFLLFTPRVDGQPIAEYKKAPFGLDRHYGIKTDKWDTREPDVTWIRAENKGLPILKHRDALYVLDVQ